MRSEAMSKRLVALCAVLVLGPWSARRSAAYEPQAAFFNLVEFSEAGEFSAARRAVAWNPLDARAHLTAAAAIFNPAQRSEEVDSEVLEWTERATEIEPGLPIFWAQLGIRQVLLGKGDAAARESLEHALELQPYHPLSLVVLRTIAERQGDDQLLATVNERLDALDAVMVDADS